MDNKIQRSATTTTEITAKVKYKADLALTREFHGEMNKRHR